MCPITRQPRALTGVSLVSCPFPVRAAGRLNCPQSSRGFEGKHADVLGWEWQPVWPGGCLAGTGCLWDQIIAWQNCSCLPGSRLSPGAGACSREGLSALRVGGVQGHHGSCSGDCTDRWGGRKK